MFIGSWKEEIENDELVNEELDLIDLVEFIILFFYFSFLLLSNNLNHSHGTAETAYFKRKNA